MSEAIFHTGDGGDGGDATKTLGGGGGAISRVGDEVMPFPFTRYGLDENEVAGLLESLRLQGSTCIERRTPKGVYCLRQTPCTLPARNRRRTHMPKLVEVFSVVLLEDFEPSNSRSFKDDLLIIDVKRSREYVLWNSSNGKFNSEGSFILTGPNCGIEIGRSFAIYPNYDSDDDQVSEKFLWSHTEPNYHCTEDDYFLSSSVQTSNGFMEVRFGVYSDGAEAKLKVFLWDMKLESLFGAGEPFQVYGIVTAFNSFVTHSQAKSVLFDHMTNRESVTLVNNSKGITLPLSRRVTVIPRGSRLGVHVNLYIRCATGDVCIAYGSVLFPAKTDHLQTVEMGRIVGKYATVMVRARWVEYDDYDENSEEEGDYDSTSSGDSGQMETGDEQCQGIPDDDGSRFVKVPRLDGCDDVSIRASEHSLTKSKSAIIFKAPLPRLKAPLLELFSVKFIDIGNIDREQIYGFVLMDIGNPLYYIFKRVVGDPCPIDSEGFVKLEGPQSSAIRVFSSIFMHTFLFKYQDFDDDGKDFDVDGKGTYYKCLWEENSDPIYSSDMVLTKTVNSQFGPLEVNYVVYRHGVEALLKVKLTECRFSLVEVYGRITATCPQISHSRARIDVFKREKDDAIPIVVRPGEETVLPLCRPLVVLPYNSSLALRVTINSGDKEILSDLFEFNSLVHGENRKSMSGNDCSVEVVVDLLVIT